MGAVCVAGIAAFVDAAGVAGVVAGVGFVFFFPFPRDVDGPGCFRVVRGDNFFRFRCCGCEDGMKSPAESESSESERSESALASIASRPACSARLRLRLRRRDLSEKACIASEYGLSGGSGDGDRWALSCGEGGGGDLVCCGFGGVVFRW